jgi:hypothetical protein
MFLYGRALFRGLQDFVEEADLVAFAESKDLPVAYASEFLEVAQQQRGHNDGRPLRMRQSSSMTFRMFQ